MSPIFMKIIHIAGVLSLFGSLGATLLGGSSKLINAIIHGISLMVVLLMGFAMIGKPNMHVHWWMVKLAIWLFIGGAPALARRRVLPPSVIFALTIAAGAYAAYLGMTRPY